MPPENPNGRRNRGISDRNYCQKLVKRDSGGTRGRGLWTHGVSLRHTYATMRLEAGTAIEALAKNMGTSVRMIEQHYGHVRTRDQREELTKQRTRLT